MCHQHFQACQMANMRQGHLIRPRTTKLLHPFIRLHLTARLLRFQALLPAQHHLFMEHLQGRILWADIRRRGHFLVYPHSKPMPIISNTDAR